MIVYSASNFDIHQIHGHLTELYIAVYPKKILLLDGGSRTDFKKIVEYITCTIKRTMSEILLIVISHAHPDHSGTSSFLRSRYNIPIAAHYTIDRWYSGIGGFIQHKIDIFLAWMMTVKSGYKIHRLWFKRKVSPELPLNDGDTLPYFEDWEVIHTPGHSTNHLVFYNREETLLYGGDIFLNIQDKINLPFLITCPQLMENSFDNLSEFPIKTVLLAHGGVFKITSESFFKNLKKLITPDLHSNMKKLKFLGKFSGEIKKCEGKKQKNRPF